MLSRMEKHIIDLLHQHDCVIIPGLGGLVANYFPAVVNEKGNALQPPKKGFIWNKFLTHNDGLLANEVAKNEGVEYPTAMAMVEEYVGQIQYALSKSRRYEFDQIGFLYKTESNLVQFEYSGRNFLLNSFGLPVVQLQKLPVVELVEDTTKVIQLEPKVDEKSNDDEVEKVIPIATSPEVIEKVVWRGSKWWIAAALIPIGFYSAWIPMKTDLFNGGKNFHYSDLNPFTYSKEKGNYKMISNLSLDIDTLPTVSFEPLDAYVKTTKEIREEENLVLEAESTFVDVETPMVNENASITLGNYFVIGGCFSDESNANTFIAQLKSEGYNAVLVDVNKGLHRVAFGQFNTKEEAKKLQEELSSSGSYSAWVLKK